MPHTPKPLHFAILLAVVVATALAVGLIAHTPLEAKRLCNYTQTVSLHNKRGYYEIVLSKSMGKSLLLTFRAIRNRKVVCSRLPRLQVDDNPPFEPEDDWYRTKSNRFIKWRLSDDEAARLMQELRQGNRLTIQYYPKNSLVREEHFALKAMRPCLLHMPDSL